MADPYETLGVTSDATDDELRAAYRRLAMIHHPDHNAGSPESTVRFAELQEAYAHVRLSRRRTERPAAASAPAADPALETRIAELERELARARELRRRAAARAERIARMRRAAQATTAPTTRRTPPARPTDAELGYVTTSDSFGRILDDLAARLTGEEDR